MKSESLRETETASSEPAATAPLPRSTWSVPAVQRLRAGLAETGPNASYDGVEGTS